MRGQLDTRRLAAFGQVEHAGLRLREAGMATTGSRTPRLGYARTVLTARRDARNDHPVSVHHPTGHAGPRDAPAQAQDAIEAEVFAAIAECLEIPAGDVRADQALEADLGVDSLGMIQIGVALEHALGFRAPTVDDATRVETVGDLVELVRAQLAAR